MKVYEAEARTIILDSILLVLQQIQRRLPVNES